MVNHQCHIEWTTQDWHGTQLLHVQGCKGLDGTGLIWKLTLNDDCSLIVYSFQASKTFGHRQQHVEQSVRMV